MWTRPSVAAGGRPVREPYLSHGMIKSGTLDLLTTVSELPPKAISRSRLLRCAPNIIRETLSSREASRML